ERNLLELAISVPRFEHYRESQTIFDGFGAENVSAFTLTGLGDAVQVLGGQVTSNYFDVLGVQPIRGRNFLPEEEKTADVAMVTENFWRKRLGGDANVIGRGITLNGMSHTIVGVLPNLPFSWVGPAAEVWTTKPFEIAGISYERIMRGSGVLRVVGRLKPAMTLEQARAALPQLEQSYRARYPDKIDSSSVMTLKTSRADLVGGLKEGGRGTSGSSHQLRFRKFLIGAQVALSVPLLAGAALLITSFVRLSQQNIGYRADNLWIGFVTLPQARYP